MESIQKTPALLRSAQGGALPNLIIIGAMKCGTTSLHYYLNLHPEIYMSAQKELAYFAEGYNWKRGEAWYRSWFGPEVPVRGEASPHYTAFPRHLGVPERMHALVPDAKLIYLVRDPVERILSHYQHQFAARREHRPLAEAVFDLEKGYFDRSRYYLQIQQYLPYYPLERILILDQEDLRCRRAETLRAVFRFLGVDPHFKDPRLHWERHRSSRKRRKTDFGHQLSQTAPLRWLRQQPLRYRWWAEELVYWPFSRPVPRPAFSPALRREVEERLADDAARWRSFTGRPFETWSI